MRRRRSAFSFLALCIILAGCSVVVAKPGDSNPGDPSEGPNDETAATTDVAASTVPADPDVVGMSNLSDDPLPDTTPRTDGVLDNGLTYAVKRNTRPGGSVSLRLAIKAGSLDELDEHTGVAHFLEHMLFNGTDAYPGNEMTKVLQGFGAEFGPEVNAFTSWDQTVYELTVPNDDDTVNEAFKVLEQWLTAATIEQSDVEAERGVVLDEWRTRTQTADGRLYDLAADMYLTGTPYAGRDPIGSDTDIDTMNADTLRAFYDTWYRPDNAAIIVVGDIDEGAIVKRIEDEFSDVEPRGAQPEARTPYEFALMTEPAYALNADPEWKTVDVEVTLPMPTVPGVGRRPTRAAIYDDLIFSILVKRLERQVFAGDAPFDDIGPGTNSLVTGLDAPALYAFTDAERVNETLTALLEEYQRAFQFGFTEAEVNAEKDRQIGEIAAAFASDEQSDDSWASEFANWFTTGTNVGEASDYVAMYEAELEQVDSAALALRFNARWLNSAPHVIISAPESLASQMPNEADVLSIIDTVAGSETTQLDDASDLPDELMSRPAPTEIVENERIVSVPKYPMKELVLANGAHVILAKNDISPSEVSLSAFSPGGLSLVADDDVVDGLYADDIVMSSGLGDLSAPDVRQFVATAGVSLEANIGTTLDRLYGSATSDSFEVLLQYLHLSMAEGRVDEVVLQQLIKREQPVVDNPTIDADVAQAIAEETARYGDEPRYRDIPTPEEFATLDAAGVERVWSQRMGNASDWTFVLAGDLPDDVEELASAYLGALPGSGVTETAVDISRPMPGGVDVVPVAAGAGNTGTVVMRFSTPVDVVTPELEARAELVNAVIDTRLIEVVREEFGDSYSPTASVWVDADPDPSIEAAIYVSGAPERLDAIYEEVVDVLDDLAGGIDAETFETATQPVYEDREYLSNYGFMSAAEWYRLQPGYDIEASIFDNQTVRSFDAADISAGVAEYLPTDQHVATITRP